MKDGRRGVLTMKEYLNIAELSEYLGIKKSTGQIRVTGNEKS